MAKEKANEPQRITPRKQDYAEWYQDVIREGQLAESAGDVAKGCMVIKPNGYAIWEKIQAELDRRFKATGHRNAYFPMLIPESFIKREAQHVAGFSPELAVVTIAGGQELEQPYVLRPTSETVIGHFFSRWIQSWRDLPMLINQWANVMRWELRTRMFLRTTEFLWQEGHTAHATHDEALEEVLKILAIYAAFAEEHMAMPVIRGKKTDSEKFAGADASYCIEAMMQDGKALQAGTSHDLGQNFGKAFDVKFQSKEGREEFVWQTSWGVSTRLIGGLVMTHSDDAGLVLPPKLAPLQAVIIPIFRKDEAENRRVLEQGNVLRDELEAAGISTRFDDREGQPGAKYFEYEKQGVCLRFDLGPKDVQSRTVVFKRRDVAEKQMGVNIDGLARFAKGQLDQMQADLFARAKQRRADNVVRIDDYKQFVELMKSDENKFVYAHWDGTRETEARVKQETMATIRCIPLDGQGFEVEPGGCMVSGKPSPRRVIWAKAY
jgi:prolyl-tRNA synthetase